MKNESPFLFFGLINVEGTLEPFRVQVSRDTQSELASAFLEQKSAFLRDRSPIDYTPGYTLEQDEIFAIPDFDMDKSILSAIATPDLTNDLSDDQVVALAVKALIAGRFSAGKHELLFQHIEKRQVLVKKRVLFWSDGEFVAPKSSGLTVAEKLDAVYERGTLFFTSDHFLRRFLDVSSAYQEATNEQVSEFLENEIFGATDLDVNMFDRGMRTRVRAILERKLLDKLKVEDVREIGKLYKLRLKVKNGKLELPTSKKEVKELIRLLVEEYYSGHFSGSQYVANSRRRV